MYALGSIVPAEINNVYVFLILGSLSAMLVAVAKAGFGGSIGMLAYPVMLYAFGGDAFLAAGTQLPLLIASDIPALVRWWRKWNGHAVRMLLPGALAGIGLAWWALWMLIGDGRTAEQVKVAKAQANGVLLLLVGVIALAFVSLQVIRYLRRRALAFRPVPWQGAVAGGLTGVCSMLANAGGPITTMFLLPQEMPKGMYVATTVLLYAVINEVKIAPFWHLGMMTPHTLWAGLLLLPAAVAGTFLGLYLHDRVGQKQFNGIAYSLLFLAGIDMVHKGVRILWF